MVVQTTANAVAPLIELRDVTMRFPGVTALDGVSMNIRAGEVHVLMGENGAGKSTLIKLLAGVQRPTEGEVLLEGTAVNFGSPKEARAAGIRTVFQELSLVPSLTVAENLFLGQLPKRRLLVDQKSMKYAAREALEVVGANIPVDAVAGSLPRSLQQLVEIAKGLLGSARLLILDEPTASLGNQESQRLLSLVRKLAADGVSTVYITHRIHEIGEIADRVTVLRDGKYIDTVPSNVGDDRLVELMIGRPVSDLFPKSSHKAGPVRLQLDKLSGHDFTEVSLVARSGEVVGIAGLLGSGKSSVGRACFGLESTRSGAVIVNGSPASRRSPSTMLRRRLVYYPSDRRSQGIVPLLPLGENITLGSLRDSGVSRFGMLRSSKETAVGKNMIRKLDIRPPELSRPIRLLSGGNQQKAVLARGLLRDCDIHVFDDPTVGIDVGARADIYLLLDRFAADGKAVVLISSDLTEIIGMCDRVYVMHEGRISGELTGSEITEENIVRGFFGDIQSS